MSNDPYTNIEGTVFKNASSSTQLTTREVIAHTATATGATTGTITNTATDLFVVVTSSNADHIIILPTPTPGRTITLVNGATGYEIRSNAPATVLINNGTGGAAVESAVAANIMVKFVCRSALAWTANTYTVAGTEAALEAAA